MMQDKGFYFVDSDQAKQSLSISEETLRYHQVNDQLMLRKFFIAPKQNGWTMVYPSTGWFSETQDLSIELSKVLACVTMALLVDDSYGWGYQLSSKGQIIDRFHTEPLYTPTLRERNQEGVVQEEIKEEGYVGNPSIIANIFNVDESQIAYCLTTEESELKRRPPHEKMRFFFKLLSIPDGDGFYDLYQDPQNVNDNNWLHLIFARYLTAVELQWRQKLEADFPFAVPPLWLRNR